MSSATLILISIIIFGLSVIVPGFLMYYVLKANRANIRRPSPEFRNIVLYLVCWWLPPLYNPIGLAGKIAVPGKLKMALRCPIVASLFLILSLIDSTIFFLFYQLAVRSKKKCIVIFKGVMVSVQINSIINLCSCND